MWSEIMSLIKKASVLTGMHLDFMHEDFQEFRNLLNASYYIMLTGKARQTFLTTIVFILPSLGHKFHLSKQRFLNIELYVYFSSHFFLLHQVLHNRCKGE